MAKENGVIPALSGACRTLYNHLVTTSGPGVCCRQAVGPETTAKVEGTATKLLQRLLLQCDSRHRMLAEEDGT